MEFASELTIHDEPAPTISLQTAIALASKHFGILAVTASDLPSERDRNVLLGEVDGQRYVLKISNSAESALVVDLENLAMATLPQVDPTLPVPALFVSLGGRDREGVAGEDGRQHIARLIEVLPGTAIEGRVVSLDLARQLGAISARVSLALRSVEHPAAGRTHDWDLRQVLSLLNRGAAGIADDESRELVTAVAIRVQPSINALRGLPAGVQHADVTLTNVLIDSNEQITGVIDFGDIHHTAAVCDLATSLTSVLRSVSTLTLPMIWATAAAFLEGYQRIRPVEPAEGLVLGDLVLARLAVTVLVSARRGTEHPDNAAYITQYDDSSWNLLRLFAAIEATEFTERITRLLGTDIAPRAASGGADLEARRARVLGGPLAPLSYALHLEIVAGEGPWLIAADGRRYLDGYNNVPVVGHANPVVAQAIAQQARRLNTNTRYLHRTIVDLAERLTATMPDALDTCIFVNSGTEANDLAWRLATHFTGGTGGLIAEWAYHGISAGTVDFSSNEWPMGHRPLHVGTFTAPHREPGDPTLDHGDGVSRVRAAVAELAGRGHAPALLLVDPQFTSEGILDAPPQFMAGLLDGVHEAGALFLADEVQSGFGRSGPQLWRFASLGVIPDLVTLGKPMGNGHPIAALVTRREIVDSFAERYEFFSTFGGNPVSCAAATAVLNVLEDNQIPALAPVVGNHLRTRLNALAGSNPVIAQVRGTGLIAGVELRVGDPASSKAFARAVVEGLREKGCLIGATGPGGNVLKIRPPLVWTCEHADLFVGQLAEVLSELGAAAA